MVDLRTGFLSRMLATLYDLEVVEEKGVRDWLDPPDNRHPFLKQARDVFAVKDNVEAKKQVLLPVPPALSLPSLPPFPSLPSLSSFPDSLPDAFPPSLPPSPLLSQLIFLQSPGECTSSDTGREDALYFTRLPPTTHTDCYAKRARVSERKGWGRGRERAR